MQQHQPARLGQAETGEPPIQFGAPGAGQLGQLHAKTVLRKALHSDSYDHFSVVLATVRTPRSRADSRKT
ncbi:hypothetical protein D3C84_1160240 [compost metagenome]